MTIDKFMTRVKSFKINDLRVFSSFFLEGAL